MKQTSEAAFETAIESVLLADGYHKLSSAAFYRERAIFPDEVLALIRSTLIFRFTKRTLLHFAKGWHIAATHKIPE
jgi:type I restriction enzyme, R subunit